MGGRGAYFNKKGQFKFSVNNLDKKESSKPHTIHIDDKEVKFDLEYDGGFIPKGATITDVHVFAGKSVSSNFRNASKWNERFNLPPHEEKNWIHTAGKVESDKYIFDIHMVEHPKVGIVDQYIKKIIEKEKR